MTKSTYNGWTNRETWVVNLHFGEVLQDFTNDYKNENETVELYDLAQFLEGQFDSMIGEELDNLSTFLTDFIDLSKIDWFDLAESYINE